MDKGPFSVEWLAQSSCGTTREVPALGVPPSPGDLGIPWPQELPQSSGPKHSAEAGAGRPRTKFSSAQLQELERSFREQRYIGASEKRRLAAALGLSQSQIKTWFQNRRMKFKRQTQDAR
ncbi:VEX1 protein, partial [Eudromia elegans]|nr:VEX1 protein [Eudromia elegans]